MLKKRNLVFLSLFILVVLLVTSCLPEPLVLVTFNFRGGSAVSSQIVEQGGLMGKPTDPTREGYTFEGWYKESSCINAWDFTNDTVTSNITLYGKWISKSYTVSLSVFPADSGTTTGSGTYHKGDLVTITATANSGYTFVN